LSLTGLPNSPVVRFRYFGNGPADVREFYLHAVLVVEPPERAEEDEPSPPLHGKSI
jgi:hypothetical protein